LTNDIKHNGTSELLIIHFGIIAQSTAVFAHTMYTCTHMLTHTQTHYTPAVAVSGAS